MLGCNYKQKSCLKTYNATAQTLTANAPVVYNGNAILTGTAISHVVGSPDIVLKKGLYQVNISLDVQSNSADNIGVQLVQDGVALSSDVAEITVAEDTIYHISLPTTVYVERCCPLVGSVLQVRLTAAGTVSNANVSVIKQA